MDITELITFILIGIGLSFDSFAVSVSCGLAKQHIRFRQAMSIAFSFALFHSGFPVIGWLAGTTLHKQIAFIDHWIAFLLLAIVGVKMIWEGIKSDGSLINFNPLKLSVILSFSIATSIDALMVGLSFGLLEIKIWLLVIIIAAVTLFASMLGILFGKKIPAKRSHQALITGGILLIAMSIKILVEHIWF
jgi:manganese efflux pump family protein